jgi:hypothetical protein
MDWDNKKITKYYYDKSTSLQPETARRKGLKGLYDVELAFQKLYNDCALSCRTKQSLIIRLKNILKGDFKIPEEVFDTNNYKDVYISEANNILKDIH